MRKLVHTPITAETFPAVLQAWSSVRQESSSTLAPGEKQGLMHYAVPSEATAHNAWHPNVGELLTMVACLGDSRASRMQVLGISQPSLSLRYKRWRASAAAFEGLRLSEARDEVLVAKAAGLKRAVQKPVGVCDYRGWLKILSVAGVLDNAVVDSVQDKALRGRLLRMQEEAITLVGEVEKPDFAPSSRVQGGVRKMYRRTAVTPFLIMSGGMSVETGAFNRVAGLEAVPFSSLPAGGVLCGYHITGEIGSLAGCVLANCILTECVFTGSLDDAMFIGCDFNKCAVRAGVDATNVTLRSCEGYLDLHGVDVKTFRAHDCGGLTLCVSGRQLTDSYITDGWIQCERVGEVREGNGLARNAPRNIARALWVNGGLDFDCESMTDVELYGNKTDGGEHPGSVQAIVKVVVPEACWSGQIASLYNARERVAVLDEAAKLFAQGAWSMRKLAEEQWQVIT